MRATCTNLTLHAVAYACAEVTRAGSLMGFSTVHMDRCKDSLRDDWRSSPDCFLRVRVIHANRGGWSRFGRFEMIGCGRVQAYRFDL